MHRVVVERVFEAPVDRVFARYCDHAGWSEWAGAGPVRLVREGRDERDGVGAVRAFGPGIQEEVIAFEPPSRMEYRIVRGGFPVTDHRGVVTFSKEGKRTRLRWEVSFRSRIPLTGTAITIVLRLMFARILRALARDLKR